MSAARDVVRSGLLFLHCESRCLPATFATSVGKQSGGEARHWRCEMCRLRVMLRSLKLRSAMRVVSLSCFGLRRGEENNRVERQDIGGVKCVGCA